MTDTPTNTTEKFFALMAGSKPFTMVPWAPAASSQAWLVEGDTMKSSKLMECLHKAAGVDFIKIGWGIAAVLNFIDKKQAEVDETERYAAPFAPTLYGLDFVAHYDKFARMYAAIEYRGGDMFFRGTKLPDELSFRAEVIPLRLGEAGHGCEDRMAAWAKAWVALHLSMSHGGVGRPHGTPQLWMWLDNGHIYGLVVPGALYQHDLLHFREDAAAMLVNVLPNAEALPPVAVQKTELGNMDLHTALS